MTTKPTIKIAVSPQVDYNRLSPNVKEILEQAKNSAKCRRGAHVSPFHMLNHMIRDEFCLARRIIWLILRGHTCISTLCDDVLVNYKYEPKLCSRTPPIGSELKQVLSAAMTSLERTVTTKDILVAMCGGIEPGIQGFLAKYKITAESVKRVVLQLE